MKIEKIRQFRTILRKFERDVAIRQKRDDRTGGLSVVQCHTVINLGELGQATIKQMAEQMGVDKSTLSRTMDGLVAKKLVDRIIHPSDRRSLLVNLTENGRQVCEKLNRVNDHYLARVFDRIPVADQPDIVKYLDLFVSAMCEENRK